MKMAFPFTQNGLQSENFSNAQVRFNQKQIMCEETIYLRPKSKK